MIQFRSWLVSGLVLFCVGIRLVPYVLAKFGLDVGPESVYLPWNLVPLTAVCLFSGAHLTSRRAAFLVPLAVLVASDLGIGLLRNDLGFAFYPEQAVVYACHAVTIGLGLWVQKRRTIGMVAGAALLAELNFFVVTNFATWAMHDFYLHTPGGLVSCYVLALPFFEHSLLGTVLYTSVLFGALAVAEHRYPALQPAPVPVTD